MNSYQIGRIQGRWKNFKPPIQNGHFRLHAQYEFGLEEVEEEDSAASDQSSRSVSPIFDEEDGEDVRKRRTKDAQGAVTPLSSVSSDDLATALERPKLSTLDAITQREIDFDLAKYPPLDPATQERIVERYRELNQQIKDEGLYQCNYWAYGIEASRYALLFALSMFFLRAGWYGTSGVFLGLFWHQLVFTAHDAGHMGITHHFHVDTVIGIIVADFIGGLSLGWWKRSHNVHHIVTNSPEHDPDIEHLPVFAVSHRFFNSLYSTYHDRIMTFDFIAKRTIRIQHYLYYPILLFGRFNLYVQSWLYLILGQGPRKGPAWWHRWLEIAGNVFFWLWFGYGILYRTIPTASGRWAFMLMSHMVTAPVHVQITLSHFAMSTADLGGDESFPQRMLRTTMDVECPPWLDFFHGGLQFQAIHHLFPRIPRHNLRRTQKLVQDFCRQVGIPYALFGFVEGNREVIGKLGEVGRQAAILAKCQQVLAEKPDFGMH